MEERNVMIETAEEKYAREMKEFHDSDKKAYLITNWGRIADQLCEYSGQYNVPKDKLVLMYQCCMHLAEMDISVAAERMLEILLFTPQYRVNSEELKRVCGTYGVRTIKDAVIIYALLDLFRNTRNPYIAYVIAIGIVNDVIPGAFSSFLHGLDSHKDGLYSNCSEIDSGSLWIWYQDKVASILNHKDMVYNFRGYKNGTMNKNIVSKLFLDYAIREETDVGRQGMYVNFKKFYYVDYLDVLNRYPKHLRKKTKMEKKFLSYHFYRTRIGRDKTRYRLQALLTEDKINRTYLFACIKYLEWEWMRPKRNYKRIIEFLEKVRKFELNNPFFETMYDIVKDYRLIKVDRFLQFFAEIIRYSIVAVPLALYFYFHGSGPILIAFMLVLGYLIPYGVKDGYELHLSNKKTRAAERKRVEYGLVPEYGREKPFKTPSEIRKEQKANVDADDVIDAMIDGYLLGKFM